MSQLAISEKSEYINKQEESSSTYHIESSFETVDSNSWMTDYNDLFYNDAEDYWEPPIYPRGLAKLAHANAYHGSLLIARSTYVAGRFQSGGNISYSEFLQFSRNFTQFGHAAFLKIRDRIGRVISLFPLPSMHIRRRRNGDFWLLERNNTERLYKMKDVIWLMQYDPEQQIYGIPDYIGGLQSSLLNKDATLFRRRYFKNGAHMGFIFYSTDSKLSAEDEKMMKETIASSKGVGNFRSMYINIPGGHEKGIQLIPVGDIATKDEFANIKNITSQDILVSHRFPAGKGGIVPTNAAGFGDPEKIGKEYARDEVIPVCRIIMDAINRDQDISLRKELRVTFDLTVPSKP